MLYNDVMSYPSRPAISKSKIDAAANLVARGKFKKDKVSDEDVQDALDTMNAWRVAHTYPLNTFNVNLRGKVKNIRGAVVAQRLKRMPTILDKLNREPNMAYTTMQDLGGVRAIVSNNKQVRSIVEKYKQSSNHLLEDEKDYITSPRAKDGYRSHHLIYKYDSHLKSAEQYNGMRIEVQIRTKLQHNWATAVETMGVILGQQLKSRQGEQDWLDFFAVVSAAFAHIEKTVLLPGYEDLSKEQTFALVKKRAERLNAVDKLLGFSSVMDQVLGRKRERGRPKTGYYLLKLDIKERTITLQSYSREDAERASSAYERLEKDAELNPNIDSVLVSVGPLDELRKAYPNYFLDVKEFVTELNKIIGSVK